MILSLHATWDARIMSRDWGWGQGMQWRRLGTQKGPQSSGGQPPRVKNGGRGLEGGSAQEPAGAGSGERGGGPETSGRQRDPPRPKGWGKACVRARAADGAPQGGRRVGFRPHLKSLSLDVIFSSKLEMWYEALAMLTASIPPAGVAGAAARCRRRCSWGSSSRLRRLPLPGSQRDADAD